MSNPQEESQLQNPAQSGRINLGSEDEKSTSTPYYSASGSPSTQGPPHSLVHFDPSSDFTTDEEIEAAMERLALRFGDTTLNDTEIDTGDLLADIGLELVLSDPALRPHSSLMGDQPNLTFVSPSKITQDEPNAVIPVPSQVYEKEKSKELQSGFQPIDHTNNSTTDEDDLAEFYRAFEVLKISQTSVPYKNYNETFEKSRPLGTNSPTLVILSPSSYDHVFSRSWVPKGQKSSIVERPQRLMACSIGIGAAIAQAPEKFELRASYRKPNLCDSSHVRKVHGINWAPRLYQLCKDSKEKLDKKQIEVPPEWHSGDIYLTPGTVNALEGVVGAVEEGIDALFSEKSASFDQVFVSVRPPGHHSHTCAPSGFCLINNVHIAIQYAASTYGVTHAVILDFDLHHGDGSQDICWKLAGLEDPEDDTGDSTVSSSAEKSLSNIGYFSLHDINSFPTETGYATAENIKNASVCLMAHGMCVWNVHLEKYTTESDFMRLYDSKYSALFTKAREYLAHSKRGHYAEQEAAAAQAQRGARGRSRNSHPLPEKPLIPFKPLILVSAGFDASENENINMRRHGVHVPTSFYNRFTKDAVSLARDYSDNKLISLLEGGYSDGALSTGIFSHLTGLAGLDLASSRCKPEVTKKFEEGCKLKWDVNTFLKRPRSSSTSRGLIGDDEYTWLASGVSLGRLLWPLDIQRAALIASTPKASPSRQALRDEKYNDIRTSAGRVLRNRSQLHGSRT